MSNQAAMQYPIDLTSGLDVNKNKNTVRQFEGFTKRNSPFINGGLSPLFSNKGIEADVITKNGKEYKLVESEHGWKLDGAVDSPEFMTGIEAELKINPSPDNNAVYIGTYENTDESGNIIYIEKWAAVIGGYLYEYDNGVPHKVFDYGGIEQFNVASVGMTYGRKVLIYTLEGTFLETRLGQIYNGEFTQLIQDSSKVINANVKFILIEGEAVLIWNDYNEYTGNVVKYRFLDPSYSIVTVPGSNYVDAKGDVYSRECTFTEGTTYNTLTFKGKATISLGPSGLVFTYNNPVTHRFYKTVSGRSYVYASSVGSLSDIKLNLLDNDVLSWSIPVTLSNGKIMYFYNMLPNGQVIDDEGNMSSNLKLDCMLYNESVITEDFDFPNTYSLLINNNVISGISYNNILLSNFLEVETSLNYPFSLSDKIIYQTKNKNFIEVSLNLEETKKPSIELLYDNYIVIKGLSVNSLNVYDIKNKKWSLISSDWNNRCIINSIGNNPYYYSLPDKDVKYISIGSGHNVNYENSDSSIASSQFGLAKYRFYPLDDNDVTSKFSEIEITNIDVPVNYDIELYYTEDETIIPEYVQSYLNGSFFIDNNYKGVTYPIQTEANILLNPSILNKFYISGLMFDSIKTIDDNFYKLIYSDAQPILLYSYISNIRNVSDMFFIQGQLFVIRNDIICSATINGNIFESVTPIVNKGNLKYLGCSPLVAYFYSETDRYIYVFTGDRNLTKYIEMSEFNIINGSIFLPDNNSLLMATDNGLFVIDSNENYIYSIDGHYEKVTPLNNGFAALDNNNKWNEYFYYNDNAEEKEKVHIKTSFYGVGTNQVSIVDTWYIRLYSDKKINGEIKCKITTITNVTTISDERIFKISANDWDNNGYVYIRYQPQLQRGVAVSLEIISDFEIFELQASILPDNTKQLSADYKQITEVVDNQGI